MSFLKKIAALLQPKPQAPVAEPEKVVPVLEDKPKKKRTFVKRDESKAHAKVAPVKKSTTKPKAAPAKAPAKKPAATKKAK